MDLSSTDFSGKKIKNSVPFSIELKAAEVLCCIVVQLVVCKLFANEKECLMATIAVQDLRPAGHDLFSDQESYLAEMSPSEELSIVGGSPKTTILISTTAICFITGVSVTVTITVL
jgi:hypothetical protein